MEERAKPYVYMPYFPSANGPKDVISDSPQGIPALVRYHSELEWPSVSNSCLPSPAILDDLEGPTVFEAQSSPLSQEASWPGAQPILRPAPASPKPREGFSAVLDSSQDARCPACHQSFDPSQAQSCPACYGAFRFVNLIEPNLEPSHPSPFAFSVPPALYIDDSPRLDALDAFTIPSARVHETNALSQNEVAIDYGSMLLSRRSEVGLQVMQPTIEELLDEYCDAEEQEDE